jgi:D-arabinose 1-dehydrogenase-like Zn-dependent alcohol dehydrogenase
VAIVGGDGGNALTGRFLERALAAPMRSLFSKQTLRVVVATVTADDLSALRKLTERGHLKPAISERYPLERAVEAVQTLERGHARGKSIVVL